MFFLNRQFLQKMNEWIHFFAYQYYDWIVSFIFWKNSRIAKRPFEINWPLVLCCILWLPTLKVKPNYLCKKTWRCKTSLHSSLNQNGPHYLLLSNKIYFLELVWLYWWVDSCLFSIRVNMLVFVYDNVPNFPRATFCKIQIFPNFWFYVFEKQNWFDQTLAYSSFILGVCVSNTP